MSNFEDVCLLSCENWIDSFPEDIPKHKFSKKHNKKMKELFEQDTKVQKHGLSKKTIKILLIAAILLGLATTVFAIPASREFIIQKFSNHSEYNVLDIKNAEEVESLQLNYIPEGFVKTEDYEHAVVYSNGELTFFVEKVELTSSIRFDTEKYDNESISINGVEAAYFKSDNKEGIIFNNGKYIFIITGNIKKEEFVKIAQNIE